MRTAPEIVTREETATSKASTVVLSELFLIVIDPVPRAMSSLKVRAILLPTAISVALSAGDDDISAGAVVKLRLGTKIPGNLTFESASATIASASIKT